MDLKGLYFEIRSRFESRSGHFTGEAILAGPYSALEEPSNAIVIRVKYA